jgi:hypothetical protein
MRNAFLLPRAWLSDVYLQRRPELTAARAQLKVFHRLCLVPTHRKATATRLYRA